MYVQRAVLALEAKKVKQALCLEEYKAYGIAIKEDEEMLNAELVQCATWGELFIF
jgi:hypothetical protein